MSTRRLATTLLLRSSRAAAAAPPPRTIRQFHVPSTAVRPTSQSIRGPPYHRHYSQEAPPASKIYFFEDVQNHLQSPSTPKLTLIDVRERAELLATGTIPGARHVPVTTAPEAFFLAPGEFADRFGFEQPDKQKELVFFCKAGVRSRAAAELARRAGWEKVGEYSGSWNDWEGRGGEREPVE